MTDQTSIGDRMKAYERAYTDRKAMSLLPVVARLDGKAFHSWTKGLERPFDSSFVRLMQQVTCELVKETNAVIGYTQSDEITLVFYSDSVGSQIFFNGKLFKMTSVLASMCTSIFNEKRFAEDSLKGKPPATFDCRVFQVPNKTEAVNCLIWREQDAVRNSIMSVAQSKFSHKQLHGKNVDVLQDMLFQEFGINWGEHFPSELKRGTYYRRVVHERPFTQDELIDLPEKHEARKDSGLVIVRNGVERVVFPILTKIVNREESVFDGVDPVVKD